MRNKIGILEFTNLCNNSSQNSSKIGNLPAHIFKNEYSNVPTNENKSTPPTGNVHKC